MEVTYFIEIALDYLYEASVAMEESGVIQSMKGTTPVFGDFENGRRWPRAMQCGWSQEAEYM